MPDILTSTAVLAADIVPVLIKERMLMLSERQLVLFGLAQKENLPQGMGKTVQFTRYERLPLPTTPLSEGVTPNAIPLTTAIVQAIVDQWGSDVALTDMGILTVRHPALRVAQERLGTQHAETIEREIQDTLNGGTNVVFAAQRSARASLIAGDNPSTDLIRQIVANLRSQGAPTYEGGHYVGVFDPFVEMDITKDATFVNAASYSNIRALYNGEVGMWMGVRWMRSNFLPIIAYLPTVGDASAQFTATNANTSTGTFVGFTAAGGSVVWMVTKLDPQTGQESLISAARTQAAGAANWTLDIQAGTGTNSAGTFNFYVSLQGSVVPLYQATLTLTSQASTTVLVRFGLNGTSNFGGSPPTVVVQATGAVAPPPPPAAVNVHTSYIFGKESFGVVDLGGLETFLTPATASDSDPLVQRRKVGWKQPFKPVILNPNYYTRFESLSVFN